MYSFKPEIFAGLFFLLVVCLAVWLPFDWGLGIAAGYLLGVLSVGLHLLASFRVRKKSLDVFLKHYYRGLFVRFLIVFVLFVFLLVSLKIDKFSFTVSFIISYIFHSVIEMIFLSKRISKQSD